MDDRKIWRTQRDSTLNLLHHEKPSSKPPSYKSSTQRRIPKLTLARLTFFTATLGLGISKAVVSDEGQETVAKILDLNLGVVWSCIAYCLNIVENECPQVASWFFEYDLGPRIAENMSLIFLDGVMWSVVFYGFKLDPSQSMVAGDRFVNHLITMVVVVVVLALLKFLLEVTFVIMWKHQARTRILLGQKVCLAYRKVDRFTCNRLHRTHPYFQIIMIVSLPMLLLPGSITSLWRHPDLSISPSLIPLHNILSYTLPLSMVCLSTLLMTIATFHRCLCHRDHQSILNLISGPDFYSFPGRGADLADRFRVEPTANRGWK